MADKDESKITVNIKSTKQKLEIEILPSQNVANLKELLREKLGDEAKGELCLIFAGKILKDEDTLKSHDIIKSGLTVHLVIRPAKSANTTSTSATSSASNTTANTSPVSQSGNVSGTAPSMNPFSGAPGTGLPDDMQAQMQQLMANPDMMRQIMESPLMQGLLSNPDALQSLLTANPQMQQLMERNPELSHILNNPDLMRQAMEMASNQSAMRELMRSQDRQLSNIESLPGGFNALARMYSEIQEPMMDAAQETLQQQLQNNPFTALFQGQQSTPQPGPSAPPGTTNTAPLPNPWGSTGGNRSSSGASTASNNSSGSGQSGSDTPSAGLLSQMMQQQGGGATQTDVLGLMANPAYREMYQRMLQNPQTRQMMSQMMQNPAYVQQMLQTMPPAMRESIGNDPEALSRMMQQSGDMLNNPQMIELLSNPEALQGMMRMMEGYQQMANATSGAPGGGISNLLGAAAGMPSGPSAGGGSQQQPDVSQLLQMLSAAQTPPSTTSSAGSGQQQQQLSAEERLAQRYRVQLGILEGMGFVERAPNLQALTEANGDINVAIDKLLNRNF